jgi:uncharacterized protein YqeY
MSTLRDRVQSDLAEAMRAHDEIRKGTLRMLSAAFRNADIEARGKLVDAGAANAQVEASALDDAALLAVIQKQAKQRRESIVAFEKAGRADLVAKESAELAVLEAYLPQQATREEIEAAARKVIAETGASSQRDIGKVMPVLTRELKDRADGRAINEVVRALLGS